MDLQIYQFFRTGVIFMSDQTICEMQYCVWKLCWSGTWKKMLQSVLVQNSDTWNIYCDIYAVYWPRKQ